MVSPLPWLRAHWRPVVFATAVLVAFALGRGTRPAPRIEYRDRVVTKTVTVEHQVEHVVYREAKQEQRHRAVHRVEVTRPDGTRVVTTDTADQLAVNLQVGQTLALEASRAAATVQLQEHELHQEPSAPPSWRVGALVGVRAGWPLEPLYGGEVAHRMLGPVWLGAWGLTAPAAGLSLSVEW